jgi:hypothetical protein
LRLKFAGAAGGQRQRDHVQQVQAHHEEDERHGVVRVGAEIAQQAPGGCGQHADQGNGGEDAHGEQQ